MLRFPIVAETYSSTIYTSDNGVIKIPNKVEGNNDMKAIEESKLQELAAAFNIAPKVFHSPNADPTYIDMEFIDGPSWKKYTKQFCQLDKTLSIDVFMEQLKTMCQFHYTLYSYNYLLHYKLGIIHNDIHNDNIILNKELTKIYYIDFGWAQQFPINEMHKHKNLIKWDDDSIDGMLREILRENTKKIDSNINCMLEDTFSKENLHETFTELITLLIQKINNNNVHCILFMVLLLTICNDKNMRDISSETSPMTFDVNQKTEYIWNIFSELLPKIYF